MRSIGLLLLLSGSVRGGCKWYQHTCNSGQCVRVVDICQGGDPMCNDESDMQYCKTADRNSPVPDSWYIRCNKTGGLPGQIVGTSQITDDKYQCIDRSDEDPYTVKEERTDQMENCTDEYGSPGVRVAGTDNCAQSGNWCTDWSAGLNPSLCHNRTAWQDIPCTWFDITGTRCTGGKSGQCIFPDQTKYDGPDRTCSDMSDQVHDQNSTCSDRSGLCAKYCGGGKADDVKCQSCLDPHNCTGSCSKPGPSCQACSNTEYFQCSATTCLHPGLRCDGHPQCSQGEDEEDCEDDYKEKKIVPADATFMCDLTYANSPTIKMWAIPCDGIRTCTKGEDEADCGKELLSFYWLIVVILLLCFISIALPKAMQCIATNKPSTEHILLRQRKKQSKLLTNLLTKIAKGEKREKQFFKMLRKIHIEQSDCLKICLMGVQFKKITRRERKKINNLYYQSELKIHNFSKPEVHLCMKNQLHATTCESILDDVAPGLKRKVTPTWMKKLAEAVKNNVIVSHLFYYAHRIFSICLSYVDLLKDLLLLMSLVSLVGGPYALWMNPSLFSSQIILLLLASVIIPLLLAGALLAFNSPVLVLGHDVRKAQEKNPLKVWQSVSLKLFTVLMSFLLPALLINAEEREKEEIKKLLEKETLDNKTLRCVLEKTDFCNVIKRRIMDFKKCETAIEIIIQIVIQITMLLLNKTKTGTRTGLEAVFDKEEQFGLSAQAGLVLSILWSFRTAVVSYVSSVQLEKNGFLSTKGKFIIGLRVFLVTAVRVLAIFFFFAPFLGQMNILAHWRADQITFQMTRGGAWDNLTYSFWSETSQKILSVPFNSLYHATPPSYSLYTGVELSTAFFIFWILLFIQAGLAIGAKMISSREFFKTSVGSKLLHVIFTLNIPGIYQDWDDCPVPFNLSVQHHKKKFTDVTQEMTYMGVIQWLSNMALLVPMIFTGLNVIARHHLIQPAIGVFPEEAEAYNRVILLMWLLPSVVTVGAVLDMVLFRLYNTRFHPWSVIIADEEETPSAEAEEESDSILEDIGRMFPTNQPWWKTFLAFWEC
eukprot:GFUD01100156.1.p1 GENE.GFUD01100156.1~~GFUD01100156.1.p1  ORF type:complete len:1047 (+),score=211.36 GFUD01100156.1:131-3271(+)